MEIKENINKDIGEDKHRLWTEKDNVIHIEIAETIDEQEVKRLFEKMKRTLREIPEGAKFLVDMGHTSIIRSSRFRKNAAEWMKDMYRSSAFYKIAIFGGNIAMRTIASFIIAASGLKNVKVFETKEKAAKWLNAP